MRSIWPAVSDDCGPFSVCSEVSLPDVANSRASFPSRVRSPPTLHTEERLHAVRQTSQVLWLLFWQCALIIQPVKTRMSSPAPCLGMCGACQPFFTRLHSSTNPERNESTCLMSCLRLRLISPVHVPPKIVCPGSELGPWGYVVHVQGCGRDVGHDKDRSTMPGSGEACLKLQTARRKQFQRELSAYGCVALNAYCMSGALENHGDDLGSLAIKVTFGCSSASR